MKTLLVTIDAKFIHKSVAVWYLKSYCESVSQFNINVLETTVNDNEEAIFNNILLQKAEVIGFSCYIWNIELVKRLCARLKQNCPEVKLILGGPELNDAAENSVAYPFADVLIVGEGEAAFAEVVQAFAMNKFVPKIVLGRPLEFNLLPSPYTEAFFLSFDENPNQLKSKLFYYESSRGCPFHCSYCLSGEGQKVSYLDFNRVKKELTLFLQHGAKTIKFIDRTFNADKARAYEILSFVQSLATDATFHFEVAADLFDERTLALINSMPLKRIQLEVGVQSTNATALEAVCRKTDVKKVISCSARIIEKQNCQVHLDLIAGLPLENLSSFINSFNDCIRIRPHKLQLGFLKLLRGSKIRSQSQEFGYKFQELPPYEVICNRYMSEDEINHLKAAEAVLNKFYNKSMFYHSIDFLLSNAYAHNAFALFNDLAEFLIGQAVPRLKMKDSYTFLLAFMEKVTDFATASHYILLDAYTYDPKAVLPDCLKAQRNLRMEKEYLKTNNTHKRIRIAYFPFLQKHIVFFYDARATVNNLYSYKVMPN